MKEQPSKDFLWNHPSNTSKIASSRAVGLVARRLISVSSQPRVHIVSLRSRNAIARSTLELKLLYRLAFAQPDLASTVSMPTWLTPFVEKSSYAASIRRSRGRAATLVFLVVKSCSLPLYGSTNCLSGIVNFIRTTQRTKNPNR